MKLCEKYGFAASASDKHSAIFEYFRTVIFIVIFSFS